MYRRWRDPVGLLAELLDDVTMTEVPLLDTGSIDVDLHGLALAIYRFYTDPVWRPMMLGLIAAGMHDPRAAGALHDFFRVRNDQAAEAARHAVTGRRDRRWPAFDHSVPTASVANNLSPSPTRVHPSTPTASQPGEPT